LLVDPFELYARTNLFAQLLAACPCENPEGLIELVRRVDLAPNPAVLAEDTRLAEEIARSYRQLCQGLGQVQLTLASPDRLVGKPEAFAVGVPRWLVVEVHNATTEPLTLGASFTASSPDPSALVPLPPQKTVPFLVKATVYDPSQTQLTLTLSGGSTPQERSFTLPITVRQPAQIRGILDGPGKVTVHCADGTLRVASPPGGTNTLSEKATLTARPPGTYRLPFFYSEGMFTLEVPPGPTRVCFERGFECTPHVRALDLKPGETRTVHLATRRFANLRREGWISGDTHVHWVKNHWSENEDLRLLKLVQQAEDIQVVNNLILKHRNGTSQVFLAPSQFPIGPIRSLSDPTWHVEMGQEYRNEGLYGHMVFLNLKQLIEPVSTGPGILGEGALDWPLNRTAILEARRQGGLSIEAHQLPFEQPANLIDGLTDSLDQLDPEVYYKVLDCGFRLPLTNGSDHPARTVGAARCYVRCDGPFTYAGWIEGIRRARTFTTSGPLLGLTVNGRGIGDEVRVGSGDRVVVHATCRSRHPIGRFQIVSNHTVLAERVTQATQATLTATVPATESRWVVCRAARGDQWNCVLAPDVAHTSAVYLLVNHQPIFRPEAARYFADHLYRHREVVKNRGRFANERQRQAALKVVQDAALAYERLIKEHQNK